MKITVDAPDKITPLTLLQIIKRAYYTYLNWHEGDQILITDIQNDVTVSIREDESRQN